LVALLNAADLNKTFIEMYTDKLIDEGFECDKDVMHLMDSDIKNEVMKDIGMKRGEMIKLERCIKHRISESSLPGSVSTNKDRKASYSSSRRGSNDRTGSGSMRLLSQADSGYTRRGTLAFMAPEIYYGTQGGYYPSKAADVFSFSMMMYEVLTGVHLTKPLEQGTFGFYVGYCIFIYCSSIH